jgi:hypothetical protein
MIATVIDPNKNWVFSFGSLVKNEVSIKMQEKENMISFYIALDGKKGINIELISVDEEKNVVEGKYSIGSSDYKDTVIFKIIEAGKLLRGIPSGALSRQVWTIKAKD